MAGQPGRNTARCSSFVLDCVSVLSHDSTMDEKKSHRHMPYKGVGTAVARELNDSRMISRRCADGAFRLHDVLDALLHLEYVL